MQESFYPQLRSPPRALGLRGLIALTFFCVAGGPYGIEDTVGAAGPAVALGFVLLIPWFWSFPVALMSAELASAMPEDGGGVIWVERAFGKFWGVQEGWWSWLRSFADNALFPVMFVDYLSYVTGEISALDRWLLSMGMVTMISVLNIRGTELVGRIALAFLGFVIAPFALLVVLGASDLKPHVWLERTESVNWGLLLGTALWNTCGWDNVGCCAGEVKEPDRNFLRAMAFTIVLVTLVYLLPLAVGVDESWRHWTEGHLPRVASRIGGHWLGVWTSIAGCVCAVGMALSLTCTSSRIPYVLATEGVLPRWFAVLHPKFGTPWVSIAVSSALLTVLVPFSFQELIEADMFLYCAALSLEFAAFLYLRIKEPSMTRPYRVPFGFQGAIALTIVPIALCVAMMLLASSWAKLISFVGMASGLLVFYVARRVDLYGTVQVPK